MRFIHPRARKTSDLHKGRKFKIVLKSFTDAHSKSLDDTNGLSISHTVLFLRKPFRSAQTIAGLWGVEYAERWTVPERSIRRPTDHPGLAAYHETEPHHSQRCLAPLLGGGGERPRSHIPDGRLSPGPKWLGRCETVDSVRRG